MNNVDSVETALCDYLQTAHVAAGPFCPEDDLIESGQLDSLLVMDLVSFVDAQFAVKMDPEDINPINMRSINSLAKFVVDKCSIRAA